MRAPWRPLVVAAALNLILTAAAAAQTVIVTKAQPGATVELVVNSTLASTVKADDAGRATIPFTMEWRDGKTEADTYVFVEYCEADLRRVILIEPGMEGYPGGQCPRKEVPGAYVVREATTLVVTLSETAPSVLVRQGKAPAGWLSEEVDRPRSEKPANAPGRGLYGFGGIGGFSFGKARSVACGSGDCSGSTKPIGFLGGATFWLTPFLGVEAAYLKPGDITLSGSGSLYDYSSTLQTDVLTMAGKIGIPVSRLRLYGLGGLTFSRAHWKTSETIRDQKVIIDGVETTYPGGSQIFHLYTQGWSWLAGGGLELSISKRVLLFGELGRAGVKGKDRQNGEGKIDDRVLYAVGGVRIRILG